MKMQDPLLKSKDFKTATSKHLGPSGPRALCDSVGVLGGREGEDYV
jgi:hypothetical protein